MVARLASRMNRMARLVPTPSQIVKNGSSAWTPRSEESKMNRLMEAVSTTVICA